jgi:hypothetical protein
VETNSELYGGARQFVAEVNSLAASVLNDLLSTLKTLGDQRQAKAQGQLSLQIFWEIINWGDVSEMGNLAFNLWNLSKQSMDPAVINRSLESLGKKANKKQEFQLLSSKLKTTNS